MINKNLLLRKDEIQLELYAKKDKKSECFVLFFLLQ